MLNAPFAPSAAKPASELREALRSSRRAFAGVGILSAGVNILALTGSVYMLQLYDRVLPAHSVPTLVGLTLIMLLLYAGFGVFDFLRAQVLSRIGVRFERALRERVFSAVLLRPLRATGSGDGLQPVRDLDQVRGFLAGPGPTALLDLPWLPFYLGLVWFLHPTLGLLGTAGSIVLFGLALLTEIKTRGPARQLSEASGARQSFGETARRNAEAVHALGMAPRMADTWTLHSERLLTYQVGTTDVASVYGSLSKVLRMVLQSAILGLGAYLVIRGEATAGVMIAASILVSRALAPVEVAIANWRGFVAARQGFQRLETLLASFPPARVPTSLPAPSKSRRRVAVDRRAGAADCHRQGRHLSARGWRRPRHHRARRVGQVDAGARTRRRMVAAKGCGAPRRRRARPVAGRGARTPRRLPAAGGRPVRRHGGPEHRPLRPGGRQRAHHRGSD
jgi:ABC-type protease/lipase transport system fused ATPase/permease subunit